MQNVSWTCKSFHVFGDYLPAVAERLRRSYPALTERAGVGSIPANPDARNVPSFRRWRFEMKLSPFFIFFLLLSLVLILIDDTLSFYLQFSW
jgi:hypothetical protein